MAFMGMALIFIIIAGIILFGMLVGGVILTVVGGVKLRAHKRNCEPVVPAVIVLVLGILISLVPLSVAGTIIIGGVSGYLGVKADRSNYDNFTDKWKNPREGFISDTEAVNDCFIPLLQAADTGDPAELRKLFAEKDRGVLLDNEIAVFLKEYPAGLSLSENIHKQNAGSSLENGVETFGARGDAELNGEYYYIEIYGCFRDEDHPENVGIYTFTVRSQTAEALSRNDASDSSEYTSDGYKYIFCKTVTPAGINSCRAETDACLYNETGRVITFAEAQEAVRTIHTFSGFTERFGEPNASWGNGWCNYYDLEPDGDKRRYLRVYHHRDDDVLTADDLAVCGTERDLYIYFDENGEKKEKDQ